MPYLSRFLLCLVALNPLAASTGLRFETNLGQFDDTARYVARGPGYALALTKQGAVLRTGDCTGTGEVRLRLIGANPAAAVEGEEKFASRSNYLRGREPSQWRADVPAYGRVRYLDIYPGIDLVFYGRQGELEYDFVLAPGADPAAIRFRLEGGESPALSGTGELVLGEFSLAVPQLFQSDGHRVVGEYALTDSGEIAFRIGEYDRRQTLVIDPLLVYSVGFGGSGRQESVSNPRCYWGTPRAIAVDADGAAYITGYTSSVDFPVIGGLDNTLTSFFDVFVTKLDASGRLVYSTYIGGITDNFAEGIAVDQQGNIVVTGRTGCDFPSVNPIQDCTGTVDAFVLKLDPAGVNILFSTFLGGSGRDGATGVALDTAGAIVVTGTTESPDFPTTAAALQPGPGPGFVTKIDSAGTRWIHSTYLDAKPQSVALDGNDRIFLAGQVETDQMVATADAVQTVFGGRRDGFVTALTADGTARIFSTYLGGGLNDTVNAIAVDETGHSYVTGFTESSDFPVSPGGWETNLKGSQDAFVSKLNPVGSELIYSTYLGGAWIDVNVMLGWREQGTGIGVDAAGRAYVTGFTDTLDFPTIRPIQARPSPGPCRECPRSFMLIRCAEAFVTSFSADGGSLIYSTYLGGRNLDRGRAIAVDSAGNAYVAGNGSTAFPWTSRPESGIGWDRIFVAKISDDGSAPPAFTADGLVNAASFQPGLSPGALSSVFGTGLTDTEGITFADELPLPHSLAGTSIVVDGWPAPLYAVAGLQTWDQVNFQTPSQTDEGTVVLTRGGATTAVIGSPVLNPHPGLFLMLQEQAAAQHGSDYTLVTASTPARPGEIIILYATGLGHPFPAVTDGYPASADPLSGATENVRVFTNGGIELEVIFAGLTPGLVGVYQINVRFPANVPAGNRDLVLLLRNQIRSPLAKIWFQP